MIIGTAGHIDHGKTALVKALTGIDADRLPDEKLRGITIDLGFAYKPLTSGQILGFVDVPGHEKFIHNMLAGATGIDYVMLVIAADDGPMPQTREHLHILDLLGLSHGVVALTKSDLVSDARKFELTTHIRQLLATTALASAKVIPVSSVSGEGVAELNETLTAAAQAVAPSTPRGYFRLAVDRSFTLTGIGVIATGTVFSGQVKIGDKLVVSPSNIAVRVRGIHAQNRASAAGVAGQRCALNLSGAEKREIKRGDWILAGEIHAPVSRIDAKLTLLSEEEKPLAHWTPAHIHLGAANVSARVALLEGDALQPGATALAQIILDEPIGALNGDRFIVRDQSASRTLGGGVVLDPFAPERDRRKPERLRLLAAYAHGAPESSLRELLELSPTGLNLARFALARNLTARELGALSSDLVSIGGSTLVFSKDRWSALLDQVTATLASLPHTGGVAPETLRAKLPVKLAKAVFIELVERSIADKRVVREEASLRLPGHDTGLSADERMHWARIETILRQAKLQPPRVSDLSTQANMEEAKLKPLLRRFAQKGLLRQVNEQHYFLPETLREIASKTEQLAHANANGIFTIAQFRAASGLSRNLTVPVLESFDRWGFTLRVGEGRKIRREWSSLFRDKSNRG